MKKKTHILVIGAALFSMFFGAGNLIFPGYLGLESGSHWIPSTIGFLITGIGFPLLGIIALAKVGGDLDTMGNRVSHTFSRFLGICVSISIGPLLAIPRTGATAYEMGGALVFPNMSIYLFAVIYFGIVLIFSLNEEGVIDSLGKILTPGLILILAMIVFKAIFFPLGEIANIDLANPFSKGFKSGYQTMDTLASIFFGSFIISSLVDAGINDRKSQIKYTIYAGSLALLGLGFVYGGLSYIGATLSSSYGDLNKIDLTLKIAELTLASFGKYGLSLAVFLACLTTSVGLVSAVSSYFEKISGGKLKYKTLAIIITTFSGLMSIGGVEQLVKFAEPILTFMYPITMMLVILTVVLGDNPNKNIYRFSVGIVALVSSIEILFIYNFEFASIIKSFPLYSMGIPWLLPGLIGGIMGAFIRDKKIA